ncbi:HAMP domain-containing sensor histidine kinase [Segeticoccus rhizosphaerae]|uniref:HAMP domain-containing sensor histidine kinase n=2 Tax=Segeticoccus rhizosphaerae TaxID=1104777 RepID=UPI0010BFEA29|nr:HAMP domain-containing sensor histidine kinase [Ornithinicoccus soli]
MNVPHGWGIRRPGLRGRVTLGFGLLTLALSVLLSVVVWFLVSRYLLSEQESAAVAESSVDAISLQGTLDSGAIHIPDALERLPPTDRLSSALLYQGAWYSTNLAFGRDTLPRELISTAEVSGPASQRFDLDDVTYLAVAQPMRDPSNVYVEVYPLAPLERTIRTLSIILVAAAAVTAVVGLGVGRMASRRALRPLTELNEVAAKVARGIRGVRLDAEHDPDLAQLARSFNRTAEALEARVVADARFAGDVSHQLRTPLTTMLNSMELLRNRRSELPESAREPLDLLDDDLARFRQLVIDLLEISRDDSGAPVRLEPVRLTELVARAADAAAGHPVASADAEADGIVLLADKRRLEQVVTNLVTNAQVHGGGCLGVRVHTEGTWARIEVDDGGPGVPEDQRVRLFERFVRGRSAQGTGTGLGLAIVARHTRAIGGRVHVEDRPGGGARFVVWLPYERPQRGEP